MGLVFRIEDFVGLKVLMDWLIFWVDGGTGFVIWAPIDIRIE